MRILHTLILSIAASLPAFAQITTRVSTQFVIEGVSSADIDGNCLVLPSSEPPEALATTLIDLDGHSGYAIAIDAEDAKRQPVRVGEAGDGDYRVFSVTETYVILFCTNFELQKQELIRLKIGEGDPEPPKPDPPDPDDDEDEPDPPGPAPIKADWLIWIEEQDSRFAYPQQTFVMTDLVTRTKMADRGLSIRIYDDDQVGTVTKFVEMAGMTRPALIIYQDSDNFRVFPAPKTTAELETLVQETVVR